MLQAWRTKTADTWHAWCIVHAVGTEALMSRHSGVLRLAAQSMMVCTCTCCLTYDRFHGYANFSEHLTFHGRVLPQQVRAVLQVYDTPVDGKCPQKVPLQIVRCQAHQHFGAKCMELIDLSNNHTICRSIQPQRDSL